MKFVDNVNVRLCISDDLQKWLTVNGNGRSDSGIRFGQHLCNTYLKQGESFSELFYAETALEAYRIAMDEVFK